MILANLLKIHLNHHYPLSCPPLSIINTPLPPVQLSERSSCPRWMFSCFVSRLTACAPFCLPHAGFPLVHPHSILCTKGSLAYAASKVFRSYTSHTPTPAFHPLPDNHIEDVFSFYARDLVIQRLGSWPSSSSTTSLSRRP